MSDSKKNRVLTVRLNEAAYMAADKRRAERGHKFQWLLESFLASYASGAPASTPYAIPPPAAHGNSHEDEDLITSMAQIQQRSAPAAAALRDLIRTLAREGTIHATDHDAEPQAAGERAALDHHRRLIHAADAAGAGADPGSAGHPEPAAPNQTRLIKPKGAR